MELPTYFYAMGGYIIVEVVIFLLFFGVGFSTVMGIHSILLAVFSLLVGGLFIALHRLLIGTLAPTPASPRSSFAEGAGSSADDDQSGHAASRKSTSSPRHSRRRRSSSAGILRAGSALSEASQRIVRRIQGIAIAYSACCFLHAAFLGYEASVFLQGSERFPRVWWGAIMFAYYFAAEIVCTGVVIYLLRKRRDESRSRRGTSTSSSTMMTRGATTSVAPPSSPAPPIGSYGAMDRTPAVGASSTPTLPSGSRGGSSTSNGRKEGSSPRATSGFYAATLSPGASAPLITEEDSEDSSEEDDGSDSTPSWRMFSAADRPEIG